MNLSHCLEAIHIRVEVNNLGGNLPFDFTSWSKLTVFNATKNHFTGVIPSSIGNISSLLALDLFQNNLTGSIPSEISHNSKLVNLNLGDNKLSRVPPQLFNISSLSIVDLAANELEGWIPADLGFTLPNLVLFFAELNKLSGAFPPSITNASNLVAFDLSGNEYISGPLPMNFGSLSRLQLLGASEINLGHNQQPDGLSFLSSLVNCTRLKDLEIGSGLSGKLPNSIGNLSTRLDTLDIGGNYIYGGIPPEIGNLFNLTRLTLNMNMLTGTIPKSICKLSKLGYLSLGGNKILGTIPDCIRNISGLYLLDISQNMLYGSIPNVLFNTSSLHALYLYENHLNGEIPQMAELSLQIVIVALEKNQLTGSLPSNIGSLKLLIGLYVSYNKLTGEIPTTLGDCLMLKELYMEGNLFEGGIPSSFEVLKGLVFLDLSDNNMTGNIPNFFGELHEIEFLNLSHNKFGGEVPKNGLFSNSSAFSVAGNFQLCGGIPSLKLPPCRAKITEAKNKQFPLKIIPLLVLLPLATLITCFIFVFYRIKNRKQNNIGTVVLPNHPYPRLSYHDLLQATTDFSPDNLLGVGRYGSVYKGVLQSPEQIIAVKVLNGDVHGAKSTFLAECETLRTIRHRNLVKIITTCDSTDFKGNEFRALVFEFMANGSLENWLHPQGNERNLTLFQRLNIAIDVALAVDYIHHHGSSKIIHCDIKPSNILLDEEFVARVSDFGLARLFLNDTGDASHSHVQTSSTGVRGTVGYVPPEYGMGGKISTEGDVYSYGILLLEMFSGKRPTSSSILTDHTNNLHDYVRNALPQKVMEIVDPRIRLQEDDCASVEVFFTSVFEVGVLCSVETPRERIDISVAIKKLHLAKERLVGRR